MELSAFTVVDGPPDGPEPGRDRLTEVLALGDTAERAGLSCLWVAEHHFGSAGLCPSPPVLLAAVAARTRRIRIGAMVSVLPFHRPVDLAEEYAMVDRISGGRLNLGLGSGYIGSEFAGFGIDRESRRGLFDVHRDMLLRAFRGEPIRATASSGQEVRLNVVPLQQPHPPLWVAVQRRESVPFVARQSAHLGLIPYATLAGYDELAQVIREYRAAQPPGFHGRISAALHVYAGDAPDRARAALQRYLDTRRATQSRHYAAKVAADPEQASAATIESAGWALIGSPRDLKGKLDELARAGVDELLGIFDFGGLPEPVVAESVAQMGRAFAAR